MRLINWLKLQIELWQIDAEEWRLMSDNHMLKESERDPLKYVQDYGKLQERRKKAHNEYGRSD